MDLNWMDIDDDLEIFEILNVGFPRQIYVRTQYFDSFNEMQFFKRFRLKKATTLNLLERIEGNLECPYNTNNSVSPINQLLVALRFYATGSHLLSVSDFCGVHVSTASRIVKRVSFAIVNLLPHFIKFPEDEEELIANERAFFEIARFPRIIGVIDGTHIKIQSPGGEDAEVFRNRKNYFSLNVQVICDSKQKIINLVARWPGSAHDQTILNSSVIQFKLENGDYGNRMLLGDSGYALKPYLLTPFLNPIGRAQQRYNESHIRTRNIVERTIGVWKRRFPVCAYGCRLKLESICAVIVATAVLHNLAVDMGDEEPPIGDDQEQHILDMEVAQGHFPNVNMIDLQAGRSGIAIRSILSNEYFGNLN